jgi:hypothetical protein
VVRAGLAVLLLAGVYLLFDAYQERTNLRKQLEEDTRRLKAAQTALASHGEETGLLEAELAALRERRQAAEGLYQAVGSEQWQATLLALEGFLGKGVRFQSLLGSASGELTVVAVAAEGPPLALLQRRLQEAGQPFELQNVQWKQDEGGQTLTATLRVEASP